MNFSLEIKYEIIKKQKNNEQIINFLNGFIVGKANFDLNQNILLIIKDNYIKEKIIAFLKQLKYEYIVEANNLVIKSYNSVLQKNITKLSSFFAGIFCASGTISNLTKTSYHLSLSSPNEIFIDDIKEKLNSYSFGFNKYHYQKKYYLYIKKQEKIADFLKAIEAIDSFFKFEDNIIQRDYENNNNRLNNIDYSNIEKIAKAHNEYLQNIEFIEKNKLQYHFNERELIFFKLIKENYGDSLNAYVEALAEKGIIITKGGLNHWIIKLRKVVKSYK
ncbi:Cytoplasmic hypothetical protein [Mycoplasmopsis meleagridis]|uniref:Uncharacterized protein n=1 Tax=Mycoplasmopsis meleagridis ATCC 25294 TaxID=1264554 RepID=A0A0F5H1S9_9BACT|nr:DNA-binding protein WhiA [Mycoplasmopsis meleagridis]KKB27080.1 Cytoplasmic hypothetical protein [Mycoplasmopsis meleagridis ATCC 25294]OAD18316.1 Cytoplasmic hypothetical protein [Mycoplasmopsis meleagridis]VEU77381.1 Uncharacterized protein conserved in bacteria [Mycoplasmopsis meleagridis]